MSSLRVYAIDGIVPVVDPTAYVHPSAVLIGDVIVGPGCYVGPCASLRGDFGRIVLHAGSNVQDSCVLHSFPNHEMRVEENGSYAMVASKGGAPDNPSWYYNVKANPRVTVQDGERVFEVTAREVTGDERAHWWELAVDAFPPYAEYQVKTDREIPVFVLS